MLILASASPRRRQLLQGLGLSFDVRPQNCEEVSDAAPVSYTHLPGLFLKRPIQCFPPAFRQVGTVQKSLHPLFQGVCLFFDLHPAGHAVLHTAAFDCAHRLWPFLAQTQGKARLGAAGLRRIIIEGAHGRLLQRPQEGGQKRKMCIRDRAKKEIGDLARSDEDVLSYVAFPQIAEKFFKEREEREHNTVSYQIRKVD